MTPWSPPPSPGPPPATRPHPVLSQAPPPNPIAAEPYGRRVLSGGGAADHEVTPKAPLTGSGCREHSYGGFGGGHPHFHPHAPDLLIRRSGQIVQDLCRWSYAWPLFHSCRHLSAVVQCLGNSHRDAVGGRCRRQRTSLIQPGFWSTSGPQVRCSIDASHDAALAAHLMHRCFHRGHAGNYALTQEIPPVGVFEG